MSYYQDSLFSEEEITGQKNLFSDTENDDSQKASEPVTCLGMTFANDDERRSYFRAELRKKLPELRHIEGFPIGSDDDIINLSDPPYYTACPNPWLNDFIAEWEEEKKQLEAEGKRSANFEVTEPYSDGIRQGKNSTIYNAHTYHTKVPHEVIMRYILHYTQPGDIVFDGFAGTGMTGVAASLCANINHSLNEEFKSNGHESPIWGLRHSICGDLSPLCFHISSNYNRTVNVACLQRAVEDILNKLKDKFGYLYEIKLTNGVKGHINYFVWSEVVACNSCGCEMNVHDLSYDYKSKTLYKQLKCSQCGTLQEKNKACKLQNTYFHPILNEVVTQTKYVETILNYSLSKSGRFFSKPVCNELAETFEGYIPLEEFPKEGNNIPQLFTVGCYNINDVYPLRTQYVLAYLYNLIQEYREEKFQLMYIFTSMLPKLTKMNRYMPQHGSRALVGPMANVLYIPPQYVENNPIDQFQYQANKVIKAYAEIRNGAVVQICSATNQSIKENSVDYIFTDPPFGSNIMYSELNLIAESWLKIKTNNKEEAISNKSQHKGILEYQDIMTNCLREYFRILKPGHWMTVEFSNTSAAFWNCLQYSIQNAGFVVTAVSDLDKERGGLYAMIGPTAVKQDLAITCYKPSDELTEKFKTSEDLAMNVWDFVEELLCHLPVHLQKDNKTTAVVERSPKILFDRVISYYVQHGYPVPMNAADFQRGLRERFVERDGMFFTAEQSLEYDTKRAQTESYEAAQSMFVGSEAEGIEWLKRELVEPKTYQDLQPEWMQALVQTKKGDNLPELKQILEENFLKDDEGRWYKPDPEKEADLEKVRARELARNFKAYVELASTPKGKIKEARLEALRYGFRECYKEKDFATIVKVAQRLPEALVMEDDVLLQFYDIAINRV